MNIFVGNLSFEAKEIDVQRVFAAFGVVTSVAIVMDKKEFTHLPLLCWIYEFQI